MLQHLDKFNSYRRKFDLIALVVSWATQNNIQSISKEKIANMSHFNQQLPLDYQTTGSS